MKKLVVSLIFIVLIVAFVVGKILSFPKKLQSQASPTADPTALILTKLSALSPGLQKADLQNGVLTATLSSGLTVIMDIKNLKPNWETTLQFILTRSKIAGKSLRTIDMRFLSPVITYGQE